MASGRLFEILYYMLDVKQTTAQELAERLRFRLEQFIVT